MMYILLIIFAIAIVFLFIKVKKLEKKIVDKQPLEVLETLKGGVIVTYKGKEILNVKPRE